MVRMKISKTQLMCLVLLILCHVASGMERKPNWQQKKKEKKERERQNNEGQHRWSQKAIQELQESNEYEERQRRLHVEKERKRQEELRLRQPILDADSQARMTHENTKRLEKKAMEDEQREARQDEQRRFQEEREQVRKLERHAAALALQSRIGFDEEGYRQRMAANADTQRQELVGGLTEEALTAEQAAMAAAKVAARVTADSDPGLRQAFLYKALSLAEANATARGATKLLEVIRGVRQLSIDQPCPDEDPTRPDDSATARRSKKHGSKKQGRRHGQKGSSRV